MVVSEIYKRHRDKMIEIVDNIPGYLDEDDPRLNTIWKQFVYELQQGLSGCTDICTEAIMCICEGYIQELPQHEIDQLWQETDACVAKGKDESVDLE